MVAVDLRDVWSRRGQHLKGRVTHSSFVERESQNGAPIWRLIEFGHNATRFASVQSAGADDGDGAVGACQEFGDGGPDAFPGRAVDPERPDAEHRGVA